MTAQISDFIQWEQEDWSICALANEWPFDSKKEFGIEPQMLSTACWRGYHCKYELRENRLFLSELNIGIKGKIPELCGITGKKDKYRGVIYEGLSHQIEYSGGIIVGIDFMRDFYVHMGFHRPHCYERVFELFIDKGRLQGAEDCTSKMEKIRAFITGDKGKNLDHEKPSQEEISNFVEEAFSLDYKTKKTWS